MQTSSARQELFRAWKGVQRAASLFGVAAMLSACLVAAPATAAPSVEVLVTTSAFGDIEFDWARDGVYCPTCNFGAGNARFNWVDRTYRLWVANIDYYSGAIYPQDGHGVMVDTAAAYWTDFGNGPEWVASQQGSQLVYTRYTPGQPITSANTGIGLAQMINGAWSAGFVDGTMGRILPAPTQTPSDGTGLMAYANAKNNQLYWRKVVGTSSPETALPFSGVGLTGRWVPGTGQFATVVGALGADGKTYQQVFWYDTAKGSNQQLTFDLTQKRGVFMFAAPEFGGDMVFFTVSDRTKLNVYRKLPDAHGVPTWTVINTITAPAYAPYIQSPEMFLHNGHTWIFMLLSSTDRASDVTVPTYLALTGIDPAKPSFRVLTDQTSLARLRQDPEYFITANGPYIYYSRALPAANGNPPVHEGLYRVDTGLGPPVH